MTRVSSAAGDPPRVAFAIGRSVGNAVARNRLRRRLRALCADHADRLAPGHSYLVGATPEARDASYADLDAAFCSLLDVTGSPR
jgi:ribonuclease P protein component